MFQLHPYALLPLISALLAGTAGVLAWRRRSATPAAAALALAMLGLVEWASMSAIGPLFTSLRAQTAFFLAVYPGVSAVTVGFLWLCRLMVDRNAVLSRRAIVLLSVEPVLIILFAATNGWHGWVISAAELSGPPPGLLLTEMGAVFWAHTTYVYALLGWAVATVLRAWRTSSDLHRRQLGTVLLSAVIPVAANLYTMAAFAKGGGADLSVAAFAATGMVVWWSLFRQGLMRLVPVARTVVLEHVSDAIVVVDPEHNVLDFNPAAERLSRLIGQDLPTEPVGRSFPWLSGEHTAPIGSDRDMEITVEADGQELDLDIRSSRLTDRRGVLIGHAVVARDLTELNARKRELTLANARLEEQLTTIERLRASLAEQAIRDVLTGLHNRRHLMDVIEREVEQAGASGAGLGVVLLDIDHFKSVNDRYGHAVGDQLLVATARTLTGLARAGDTIARYGGEEFVILLPGATTEQAWARAEEWRLRCAATLVESGSSRVSSTFSAGVAIFPECGRSPAELLHAADGALYAAKAAGRNRVLLADPVR